MAAAGPRRVWEEAVTEGDAAFFQGLLDEAPDCDLLAAVSCLDGVRYTFWDQGAPRDGVLRLPEVEAQLRDSLEWAARAEHSGDAEVRAAFRALGVQRLAAVRAWTGKLFSVVTSAIRSPARTKKSLAPVLPYMKLMHSGLHALPESFIINGTLYRGERGVRTNWDQVVRPGGRLKFYAPTSFTLDPKIVGEFADHPVRTVLKLRNGVGYRLDKLSLYHQESEVLVEGVFCAVVEQAVKFHVGHEQVLMGQVREGLHYIEAELAAESTSLLTGHPGSPVHTRLRLRAGTGTKILMVGNPGSGKSTLLNSLLGRVEFRSGVSYGGGLTYQFEQVQMDPWTTLLDTPGLCDVERREAAAAAITQALRQNGNYKIFFVVTLDKGRVRAADVATMRTILDAAPITEYGIIVNQVSKRCMKELDLPAGSDGSPTARQRITSCLLHGMRQPTTHVYWVPVQEELEDADNRLWEMPTELRSFILNLPGMTISEQDVKPIDCHEYDKKLSELEAAISTLLADKRMMAEQVQRMAGEMEALKAQLRQEGERPQAEWRVRLEDADVEQWLATFAHFESVTHIDLSVWEEDMIIEVAKRCPNLVHIAAGWMTDNAVKSIAWNCRGLQVVDFSGQKQITDVAVGHLTRNCKSIQRLDLSRCSLGDQGLRHILANCENLQDLDFSGITNGHAIDMSCFPSYNMLTKDLASQLTVNCKRLEQVNFSDCAISDDFVLHLAANCKGLQQVNFAGSSVTGAALVHLAANCRNLRQVNFANCFADPFPDAAVMRLATSCTDLQQVDFAHCGISDAALQHLAANCRGLRHVNVAQCDITDAAVLALAANCKSLQELDVAGPNRLTDAAVFALAASCQSLQEVVLSDFCTGCKVRNTERNPRLTDAAVRYLKDAIPGVVVCF